MNGDFVYTSANDGTSLNLLRAAQDNKAPTRTIFIRRRN